MASESPRTKIESWATFLFTKVKLLRAYLINVAEPGLAPRSSGGFLVRRGPRAVVPSVGQIASFRLHGTRRVPTTVFKCDFLDRLLKQINCCKPSEGLNLLKVFLCLIPILDQYATNLAKV